jgi:hypothetical protein
MFARSRPAWSSLSPSRPGAWRSDASSVGGQAGLDRVPAAASGRREARRRRPRSSRSLCARNGRRSAERVALGGRDAEEDVFTMFATVMGERFAPDQLPFATDFFRVGELEDATVDPAEKIFARVRPWMASTAGRGPRGHRASRGHGPPDTAPAARWRRSSFVDGAGAARSDLGEAGGIRGKSRHHRHALPA